MTIKVHLDTDIGSNVDDLAALALLLRWPDVEITGITTTAEDGGRRAGYVNYVLRLAGRTGIPVAAGADAADFPLRSRPVYPPEADFWPEPVRRAPGPVQAALELLAASIRAGATIIGIGPYTNLALLDGAGPGATPGAAPGLLGQARLVLMGGYVAAPPAGYPQRSNATDYNVQMDVAAAQRVFASGRPLLVPLNITVQTALRRAFLPGLRAAGPLAALVARQAEAYAGLRHMHARFGPGARALPADSLCFLHDPLACAVALGWPGARIQELPIVLEIRDGWLYERVDGAGQRLQVVTEVDGPGFGRSYYEMLTGVRSED